VSNPPRRLRLAPGAAGRQDRSAALAEGTPDAFAGTVLDPADARLAGAFSAVGVGAADRLAARPDAARDLLVARDVPGQRRAGGQRQRLEAVDGHRGPGRRLLTGGALVRGPVPGGVDGRVEPQVPRGPRAAPRPRHPGEGRDRAARPAAPAGDLLQRRAGGSTTCGACGSTRGSRGARTSHTGTP
jgi:hypothetical protein